MTTTVTPHPSIAPVKLGLSFDGLKIFSQIKDAFLKALPPIPEWVIFILIAIPLTLMFYSFLWVYLNFYRGR